MVLYGSTEDTQSTQGLRKGGKNKLEKVSRSQPDWLALCVKQEGCWLSLCPEEWMDRLLNGSTTSSPDTILLWLADITIHWSGGCNRFDILEFPSLGSPSNFWPLPQSWTIKNPPPYLLWLLGPDWSQGLTSLPFSSLSEGFFPGYRHLLEPGGFQQSPGIGPILSYLASAPTLLISALSHKTRILSLEQG